MQPHSYYWWSSYLSFLSTFLFAMFYYLFGMFNLCSDNLIICSSSLSICSLLLKYSSIIKIFFKYYIRIWSTMILFWRSCRKNTAVKSEFILDALFKIYRFFIGNSIAWRWYHQFYLHLHVCIFYSLSPTRVLLMILFYLVKSIWLFN